jgi:glycosyltransferase involved in cell wall biosynthesis
MLAMRRWATNRSYTLQEAMLGSADLRRSIEGLLGQVRPSIEVYDTLRLAQHAPPGTDTGRRYLYLDDLFSVRYQRMLDVAAGGAVDMDPLGGFVDNVPARLRPLVRHRAVYLPLLRSERSRIRRREAQVVHEFDASLLVSPREVGELRRRSGSNRITALTPRLPPLRVRERRPVQPPELVYLGKLNIPHNDDAVCTFIRTVMPALAQLRPDVRVRVIGKQPSAALRALAAAHPGVALEGYVDDLDEVLARATALLAPLRFGSGIKIKVLDALGRGVPVIATSTAAEGIPVSADGGDGCLVEDDLARWAGVLVSVMSPQRAAELSGAALRFYRRIYAPAVVSTEYDEIFGLSPGLPQLTRAAG